MFFTKVFSNEGFSMIYLYSCSGSADHGCEAAARAVKQLLGCPMRLYSQHVGEEYRYKMHELMDIGEDKDDDSPRKGRRFTVARMQTKFRNPEDKEMFFKKQEMLSTAKAGDIWLCMDEEAYCRREVNPVSDADCTVSKAEQTSAGLRLKNKSWTGRRFCGFYLSKKASTKELNLSYYTFLISR